MRPGAGRNVVRGPGGESGGGVVEAGFEDDEAEDLVVEKRSQGWRSWRRKEEEDEEDEEEGDAGSRLFPL